MEITRYLTIAPIQTAGKILFLMALGLLLGSSLLAFISEIKFKADSRTNISVMSHNLTRASWLWLLLFALVGGTIVFLPRLPTLETSPQLLISALAGSGALLFFLIYHFTGKLITNKFLHTPLALLSLAGALGAAIYWYHLPQTWAAWSQTVKTPTTSEEIFHWWLGRDEIAFFLHFFLNAVALAALFFMLANAGEKEKKRKQTREYYFQASAYAGSWLLSVTTLQILPLSWLFYQQFTASPTQFLSPPEIYWLAAILTFFLLGWLLLIKITRDGLVNRRASMIIGLCFIVSLSLFHLHNAESAKSTTKPAPETTTQLNN
ncbi:MAG: hypothetical protein JXR80_10200 [Deltaproteobacteria bacterium]|nr:hypothetical protein [Deltaproteobacteria bacterium]